MDAVDHVLYAVRDLEVAGADFRQRYGLGVLPGGVPAPGLLNAVVPLQPPCYLELITVTDPAAGPQARRLADRIDRDEGPYTFVIDPDDLDAVATRVGVEPWSTPGAPWRLLGDVEPERPFFIEYDRDRQHRAEGWRGSFDRAGHDHRVGGFSFLEVAGDRAALTRWIGEVDVPIRWCEGEPGLHRVGLSHGDGELVISRGT